MKAAVFRQVSEKFAIVDLPVPEPAPHEVILKVERCGICGSDLKMTENPAVAPPADAVIGHEFAGEVVAIGSAVTKFKPGDRVAAMPIVGCGTCAQCQAGSPAWCAQGMNYVAGGYAQYARAGEFGCFLLPPGLDAQDGALVEPLAVSLHGIRMAGDFTGKTVKVIGAGPIGLSALFWARHYGAARIAMVDGNADRGRMALAMGADEVHAPTPADAAPLPPEMLADIVVECVGKPGLLTAALAHVRPGGQVVSLGFSMMPEQFTTGTANRRDATIHFPMMYTIDDYQTTLDVLASGKVQPRIMVTGVVSLAELPDRFEELRNPGTQCKVMIDPWAA